MSHTHAAEPAKLPPLVPGKLEWNCVGNTHAEFEDDKPSGTGRWVQNFVDEIEVTPDGTVIAGCFWDEGGRCLGLYKDGRPANQCKLYRYVALFFWDEWLSGIFLSVRRLILPIARKCTIARL